MHDPIGAHGSGALGSQTTTGNYGQNKTLKIQMKPEEWQRLTESPWKCSADQGTRWHEKQKELSYIHIERLLKQRQVFDAIGRSESRALVHSGMQNLT